MNFDLVRFTKLMNLTTSPNDGEALSALRIATSMLLKSDLTWSDFIAQKTIVINEIVQDQSINQIKQFDNNDEIRKMLDTCLMYIKSESGHKFISSLNDWYKQNNMLTKKQEEALHKWYDNLPQVRKQIQQEQKHILSILNRNK